jgi:predicted HAD superfamily phosphohydrolase YqeG
MFCGLRVKSINNIRWDVLKKKSNVRFLIFDKDETITDYNVPHISEKIHLDTFRDIFHNFETNVFMLSNNRNHLLDETALEPLKKEIKYNLRNGK